jgi:hypothetical protein
VRRNGEEPIGAVAARDVSRFCSKVLPIADGTTMHWVDGSPPEQYILVTLIPRSAGTTRVDRVTFNYARDWRHGHQHGQDTDDEVDISIRATS